MTSLSDLIERVRSAEGPDRELDAAIDAWLWRNGLPHYGELEALPDLTASIDAALSLAERVLPALVLKMTKIGDGSGYIQITEAWMGDTGNEVVSEWSPMDPRPGALAVILATLTALQQQAEQTGDVVASKPEGGRG